MIHQMDSGYGLTICLAILFHIVFMYSIFDIYFVSPIEKGITPIHPDHFHFVESNSFDSSSDFASSTMINEVSKGKQELVNPPSVAGIDHTSAAAAKRLVLFVADGLRADTCFEFLGRDARYAWIEKNEKDKGREATLDSSRITWPSANTSYLRDIIETQGSFGLSHTRVPTESRPGHVAIIGGFYEDVSAVTRGWTENPCDFDHVFNQSSRTFAFGSPDITRMFAKHSGRNHITDTYYPADDEDFASHDLSMLDTWVFNKVTDLLNESLNNQTVKNDVEKEKSVFFLHLLGLDSNGHAHHPHGKEYTQNMALVDQGVSRIVDLFEKRFPDKKTVYVFTSDHGMSARGSHGDGDPSNTRTPFIAWGSGIAGPEKFDRKNENEMNRFGEMIRKVNTGFASEQEMKFSRNWGLSHLKRKDIQQADIASLMSALLNIPIPVNSIGILPMDYLHKGKYRAKAILLNAKQLLIQVQTKEAKKKETSIFFREYMGVNDAKLLIQQAQQLFLKSTDKSEVLDEIESKCIKASNMLLDAFQYYQTYDRMFLSTMVTLAYIGWILHLLSKVLQVPRSESWEIFNWIIFLVFASLFVSLLLAGSPIHYMVYVFFPAFFWCTLPNPSTWLHHSIAKENKALFQIVVIFTATQIMVLAYTYRSLFFILFVIVGLWPIYLLWDDESGEVPIVLFVEPSKRTSVKTRGDDNHPNFAFHIPTLLLKSFWFLASFGLGCFTLIPIDINNSVLLMAISGVVMFTISSLLVALFRAFNRYTMLQLILQLISIVVPIYTDISLKKKQGLPVTNQYLTWFVFIVSLLIPRLVQRIDSRPLVRMISIFIALSTQGALLNVNYESSFFTVLGINLLIWCIIERSIAAIRATNEFEQALNGFPVTQISPLLKKMQAKHSPDTSHTVDKSNEYTIEDFRVGFLFILYVHVAFFGTGNFASMSSFQISSTFRFTSIFSPFLMGFLLIYKLLIPHLLVATSVIIIIRERIETFSTSIDGKRFFLLVIALCDAMALHLFFWVTDIGSWLEIGNSISQYGFIVAQLVFLPIIVFISHSFLLNSPTVHYFGKLKSEKERD